MIIRHTWIHGIEITLSLSLIRFCTTSSLINVDLYTPVNSTHLYHIYLLASTMLGSNNFEQLSGGHGRAPQNLQQMLHLQAPTFIAHYLSFHILTWNQSSKYIRRGPGLPWTASFKLKTSLWGTTYPWGNTFFISLAPCAVGIAKVSQVCMTHHRIIMSSTATTNKYENWLPQLGSLYRVCISKLLQGCISGTNCRAPERKVIAFVAERHSNASDQTATIILKHLVPWT